MLLTATALAATALLSTVQVQACNGREVALGEVFTQGGLLFVVSCDEVTVFDVDWGRITPPELRGDVWYFDLPTRWWSEVIAPHGPRRNPRVGGAIPGGPSHWHTKKQPGGQFEMRFY